MTDLPDVRHIVAAMPAALVRRCADAAADAAALRSLIDDLAAEYQRLSHTIEVLASVEDAQDDLCLALNEELGLEKVLDVLEAVAELVADLCAVPRLRLGRPF